jgi:uncharacterized membrane protein YccC
VDWRLTVERLACTLAGGSLALIAAHFFWPSWEKDRFQPLMKEALLANCHYIGLLSQRLRDGTGRGPELIPVKRRLETANSEVFASLQRMYSQPRNRADILQDAAAMANGNLRLTRVLNLLLLHLTGKPSPVSHPMLAEWEGAACQALQVLAASWDKVDEQALRAVLNQLETMRADESWDLEDDDAWVVTQLSRGSTELSAMIIDALPERISPQPQQV